jgi:hypothetical protein
MLLANASSKALWVTDASNIISFVDLLGAHFTTYHPNH